MTASPAAASDPLAEELQAVSGASPSEAKDDAACEAAWAENRRRFFTYGPTPSNAASAPRIAKIVRQVGDMGGTGVIDNFLGTFTQYIDSGFGLVQGDVRWLAGVLIAIDITLAGLFWAMAPDEDVIARLIRKTLYYRRLRLHHRQLQQPRADHLQLLRRARHRGRRRHHERRAASSARQDRRGRHRRRQADPDRDLRHDGLHQRLRELGADS